MKNIVVDKSKCTHCGLCISDCVSGCISFDGENFPKTDDEKRCISCQHCLAICPTGALSFGDKHPNNSQNVEYSDILGLIKSRKSVRQYKEEEIPQELLDKLKQMLPYVPTGCNNHSLHFSIVETKSAMDEIRKKVNDLLIKTMSYKALSPIMNKFSRYKDAFLKGEDEWKKILEKICKAFRLYINCDNDCIEDLRTIKLLHGDDKPDELEKILKDHEDYEEGMALFFQYWKWLGD